MPRSGLTLFELMVVMIVVGLLAALAVPRFSRLRDASAVRAAMMDLGSTFASARQTAMTRRTPVAVVFDTANGVVRLRANGETLLNHALRANYAVSLGANRDSAVYDPRGLGYGVSNLSVTVRRGSFVDTLTMSRLGRTTW
jgi:prepilin-type N-terminal cleavage/methylation domain-containing protein